MAVPGRPIPVLGQLNLFPRVANEFCELPVNENFVFTQKFKSIPKNALLVGLNGVDIRAQDYKKLKKTLSKVRTFTKFSIEYFENVDPSERLTIDVS